MELHDQVAKLPCDAATMDWANTREAYECGHLNACRAAAALVKEQSVLLAQFRREVERCFDLAQRMDALEPGVPGAFTGTPSERIARQLAVMRDEFAGLEAGCSEGTTLNGKVGRKPTDGRG